MSRLLQVIIAIAGLAITIMLHLAARQNEEEQARQTYVAQFTETLAYAITTCNPTMLSLAVDAAKELDTLDAGGSYEDRVTEVMGTCASDTPEVTETPPADGPLFESAPPVASAPAPGPQQSRAPDADLPAQLQSPTRNLELQRQEVVTREQRSAQIGGFYAVLASYAVRDRNTYDPQLGASAHFNRLVEAVREAGLNVRVFRTSVSNHFAIVLEPEGLTRDNARNLVARARREGWSPDAFVQQERNWVACETPGTIDGLRACQGRNDPG